MERGPSGCRAGDHHVSDGREADQGGDGQGRSAAPAASTLRKVVCGYPLPTTDLLGYIIIFESLIVKYLGISKTLFAQEQAIGAAIRTTSAPVPRAGASFGFCEGYHRWSWSSVFPGGAGGG